MPELPLEPLVDDRNEEPPLLLPERAARALPGLPTISAEQSTAAMVFGWILFLIVFEICLIVSVRDIFITRVFRRHRELFSDAKSRTSINTPFIV